MSSVTSVPVSRDLARIIREASRLEATGGTLNQHLQSIEQRQSKAVEFYFRSCSLRLRSSRQD